MPVLQLARAVLRTRAFSGHIDAILLCPRGGRPQGVWRSAMRDIGRGRQRSGCPSQDNPEGQAILGQGGVKHLARSNDYAPRHFPGPDLKWLCQNGPEKALVAKSASRPSFLKSAMASVEGE